MWNAGLDALQTGIKIARRNINNLRYADDTSLLEENEEALKSLLMKVKKQKTSAGIWCHHFIASRLVTSRNRADVIFLGSKITADVNCSHEMKRHLLLERKANINLVSVLKSRDISLPTKVHIIKAMVFLVVVYGCESWTIKKANPKNWCFQTVVLEKTLKNPLDSKEIKSVSPKGNQPWIFTGRTDTEAEAPILWPLDGKNRLVGKDLDAEKDWGQDENGVTEKEMIGWHQWISGLWVWGKR